jgi:class 3 adenylate cyclase
LRGHGEVANAIIPVDLAVVEAFLGRIADPRAAPDKAALDMDPGLPFDKPPNAVRAAADIQRSFYEYNSDASETLSVRIGIAAGEPVAAHNDLFGATVQLASRLCSEAEADGIVLSGLVREMCDEEAARFVALGERRLKGFAEKLPAFRFEWRG